jgi:hypothetical protein
MLCDGLAFGDDIEWPSGRYLHENFQVAWRLMSREGIWDENFSSRFLLSFHNLQTRRNNDFKCELLNVRMRVSAFSLSIYLG